MLNTTIAKKFRIFAFFYYAACVVYVHEILFW
jgi:hypothetical protein